MSNATTKPASNMSAENVLRSAHNPVDGSITTNGFLVGQIGHKVTAALSTTSVANDTVTYTFLDNGTVLYAIKMVFPTAQTLPFTSAERVI
jgi:hypothetical protein